MKLSKDFLWGGSIAAHQLEGAYNEGGKGLNTMDLLRAAAMKRHEKLRRRFKMTSCIHRIPRSISIIVMKRTLSCLQRWDFEH